MKIQIFAYNFAPSYISSETKTNIKMNNLKKKGFEAMSQQEMKTVKGGQCRTCIYAAQNAAAVLAIGQTVGQSALAGAASHS
ncbi:MAG: TIGR04149 family rSAM-modified RiPP [Thermonemataceae bacterium]|nr:TIGR04149 family rSAM-modified RiPP [Thermonemataceae bacterium]